MNNKSPRIALVYMPFGKYEAPSLGISLLKSELAEHDNECEIFYFNMLFADELGLQSYRLVTDFFPYVSQVGEWLFAPEVFGENIDADNAYIHNVLWKQFPDYFTPAAVMKLLYIRSKLHAFLQECADSIDWSQFDWVGFSSIFNQNCASLAMAKLIKEKFPKVRIILGGASCTGEAGISIPQLYPFIDYVCIGEGDIAFPELIHKVAQGEASISIPGIVSRDNIPDNPTTNLSQVSNMDILPNPDYSDYFNQLKKAESPIDFQLWIPIESSRGCWWGQKSHCTFCGFNCHGFKFRSKSPERLMNELVDLKRKDLMQVYFCDNILDYKYFHNLLPTLAKSDLNMSFFCELKSNLKSEQIKLLSEAGFRYIHPGIESLNNGPLKLMRKGTTIIQNIQTLKWSKQFGIKALWNYLYGFPGEDPAEYLALINIFPMLFHLDSPGIWLHIRFEHFGAYHNDPSAYGITSLTPALAYKYIYHSIEEGDLNRLALHFDAKYEDSSPIYEPVITPLISEWQKRSDAVLDVYPLTDSIRIVDTRKQGEREEYLFDGLAAHVYMSCDAAKSIQGIMNTPAIREIADESVVASILNRFIDMGLMIGSGKKYLSLAVIRQEN